MTLRFARLWTAIGLGIALWSLTALRESENPSWIRPVGSPPGPVRILRFYASVGTLAVGEKARLCYGVENAKSVRISPLLSGIYPASRRCVEIVPEHTTHYTIFAEGFDGKVATQSFTLSVYKQTAAPRWRVNYAGL